MPEFPTYSAAHICGTTSAKVNLITFLLFLVLSFQPNNIHAKALHFRSDSLDNIFHDSSGIMRLAITDRDDIAWGSVVIEDEAGNIVRHVPLPKNKPLLEIKLDRGFYRLKVQVHYKNRTSYTETTTAAIIGTPIPNLVRKRSRLGFFSVDFASPHAVMAGGRWNRTFLHIKGYAETTQGFKWIYPWTEPELPKNQTWIRQLTVIPAWLRGDSGEVTNKDMYPPKNWGKFASLLKWVIAKNISSTKYIEILNEPEWHWKGSDESLVKYFNVASNAIHEVDSSIQVLGPSFATIDIEKFKRLVALGLLNGLDGISMHAYVNGSPPEAEFIQRIIQLRQYLKSIGKDEIPLYLTEFGWTTEEGTWQKAVDNLTQARYVSRSIVLLLTQRIDAILLFCLKYETTNLGEKGFSLLNPDNSPKPAYAAYANVAHWLSGADGIGQLIHLSPLVKVAKFHKSGKEIAVLWTVAGEAVVSVPCTINLAQDMMGRNVPMRSGCRFKVGESPLFIEGDALKIDKFGIIKKMANE